MDRRLEYQDLDSITPAPNNPKEHRVDGVRASIDRFGYVAPMIVDDRTGRLVVGHGRLESLKARRNAGETPPEGVRTDETGRWLVPIIHGWSSRSDADAAAYLVLDNRQSELGGWDHQALADLLDEIGDPDLVELTGWDPADLEELLDQDDDSLPPGPAGDDVPPPRPDPISVIGDLWILGKHRVLCGDATDLCAVERLLGGRLADCMWTDPPYGVNYVGKTEDSLTIENDESDGLRELLDGAFAVATAALKPGAPIYVAHPPGPSQRQFIDAFERAGWSWRQTLIWVKDVFVLGHSDYHYRHKPILYGFTQDGNGRLGRGGPGWNGDNAQDTVFEFPKPLRNADHPTMKPVELIAAMLANSTPKNGLVFDPFGGSGSTLLAAHQVGATSAVMDIDARYVDVICRRYQQATNMIPVRVTGDGSTEPHDFLRDR